jgi:hypothetical protein
MQRSFMTQVRQIAPVVAAVAAAVVVWLAARALAQHIPGPPGFDVTISDGSGTILTHARAPILLTPEVAPTPPPGAKLVARATYLAREAGTYKWQLGCTCACMLRVDGKVVQQPRPGRVAGQDQPLEAGLHELEVTMPVADAAGGVAFGARLPSAPWRSPLLGPGDVVAAPRASVEQRLGDRPVALLHLLALLPFLLTLFTSLAIWLAVGGARRQRVREQLASLRQSPLMLTLLTATLLGLIVLPMIAPLFAPGYYACQEEESYIVRLIQYDWALRGGVPLGRWWPDPVLGRGYPFLCLYAPLLYLLATPFMLVGAGAIPTLKIISGLAIVVGAGATFMIVRRHASRPAALLAATLFAYAPYVQTDVWIRADLAESLGFACFPLTLLALDRILDPRPKDAPPPYAAIAGLALTLFTLGACHNITAYFSIYFLALWLILRVAMRTTDRAGLLRVVAGGLLGFAMTVFFVVPAMVDRHRVWVERIITGYYDALRNFVPLTEVLTWKRWDMRLCLGINATIAIAAGLAAVILTRGRSNGATAGARRLAIIGAAGTLLALAIITPPLGTPFLTYVPLARNVAFPWRLFVFVACLAPLCVGAALDGFFTRPRARWVVSLLAIAAIMIELGPIYGPPAPLVRSHLDVEKFLRSLDIDYVTSMNEYLPRTVKRHVSRFGEVAHVIDGTAQLSSLTRSPGKYDVTVDAPAPALVELNAHWFPGWRARVDGAEVAIGPGARFDDGGLIRVALPAGHHTVTLRYGRTPLRLACDLFSLLAFAVALALLGLAARQKLLRYRRVEKG